MRNVTVRPGGWSVTANATNATATASKAASANSTSAHYVSSISGSFSAAAAGILMVLKQETTEIGRWYVTNQLHINLSVPIKAPENTAVSVELSAGGAAVVGAVTIAGYTI